MFEVRTLGIVSGEARFDVGAPELMDGLAIWPIVLLARSLGVTESLYPVRERFVSFWDPQRNLPVEGDLTAVENGRKRVMNLRFLREGAAGPRVQVRVAEPAESDRFVAPMAAGAQDIQSAVYWLRTRPLQVGDAEEVPIVAGKRQWNMAVVVDRREFLDVPAGHFASVHVAMGNGFSGKLRSRGAVDAHFSDDARHLPLAFEAELGFGKVSAQLLRSAP